MPHFLSECCLTEGVRWVKVFEKTPQTPAQRVLESADMSLLAAVPAKKGLKQTAGFVKLMALFF